MFLIQVRKVAARKHLTQIRVELRILAATIPAALGQSTWVAMMIMVAVVVGASIPPILSTPVGNATSAGIFVYGQSAHQRAASIPIVARVSIATQPPVGVTVAERTNARSHSHVGGIGADIAFHMIP